MPHVPLRNDLAAQPGTKQIVAEAQRTNLLRSAGAALGDHAVILVAAIVGWVSLESGGEAAVAINALALLMIARSMRGLENLVHEASHYNFTRNKAINDLMAALLVASPVCQSVAGFRIRHLPHHHDLGGPLDGDRARNLRFEMDRLDRTSAWAYARHLARQGARYMVAWFCDIGTDRRTLAGTLLWHAIAMSAIGAVSGLGPLALLACWALYWCVPFFLVLPVLRFVAEAEEHVYAGAATIGAATVSNLGWLHRWVLHPHGDGYHTLHHLRPAIPHHRLAAAHRRLLAVASDGYGAGLRVRTHVLEAPVPYALVCGRRDLTT